MFCLCDLLSPGLILFFFNDTATTEIYTLSLHDALPIFPVWVLFAGTLREHPLELLQSSQLPQLLDQFTESFDWILIDAPDRKSTRLNSSHSQISYAVFCLKKKKNSKHLEET